VRLFDLILALAMLAVLVFIASHEFPAYEGRAVRPAPPPAAASPLPSPAAQP
jgi:hypothetical protein